MSKAKSKPAPAGNTPGADHPTTAAPKKIGARKPTPKSAKPEPATAEGQAGSKADAAARPASKLEQVIALLRGKNGTTMAELIKVTDWQPHSVRGAISGAIKKRLGLKVTTLVRDGVRVYRIER